MLCTIWWVLSHYKEGISHHFQNFISKNLNVDGQNKCHRMVSRKISLFGKMQRGRSPSFGLFQLDMYALYYQILVLWDTTAGNTIYFHYRVSIDQCTHLLRSVYSYFSSFQKISENTNAHACLNELLSLEHGEVRSQLKLRACNALFSALDKVSDAVEISNEDQEIQVQDA